jgi:hypothetical protein
LKQKTLNLKAHGEISQCIWRALYIALNIALRKEEEKIKRWESMGLGEGEVVQQHTDASIAYFSLITCREPFRRNSYVERRRTNVAGSCNSSDVPS